VCEGALRRAGDACGHARGAPAAGPRRERERERGRPSALARMVCSLKSTPTSRLSSSCSRPSVLYRPRSTHPDPRRPPACRDRLSPALHHLDLTPGRHLASTGRSAPSITSASAPDLMHGSWPRHRAGSHSHPRPSRRRNAARPPQRPLRASLLRPAMLCLVPVRASPALCARGAELSRRRTARGSPYLVETILLGSCSSSSPCRSRAVY